MAFEFQFQFQFQYFDSKYTSDRQIQRQLSVKTMCHILTPTHPMHPVVQNPWSFQTACVGPT